MYKIIKLIVIFVLLPLSQYAFSGSKEDPLRPPGYSKTVVLPINKNKTWYVNEILASEGRRIAIVNGKMVKVGDTVDGAKVIKIASDKVKLHYKNRIIDLPLTLIPVKRLIKPGVGH